jgi:hypothetical protein
MNEHKRHARYRTREPPAFGAFERTMACGTMEDSGDDMVVSLMVAFDVA